jgi:hypothetical protein
VTKILWYLLFLLGYAIFSALTVFLLKPDATKTKMSSFPYLEASSLLSSVMLYVLVLILTRFSILLITVFYFLSVQLCIFAGTSLGIVTFRRSPNRYLAETIWASVCFSIRNVWLLGITIYIEGLALWIGYPVVAGIIYFSGTVPSTAVTLAIIRITLLILFVGGLAVVLPSQVGVALSENLSSGTRRRFFAFSATGILSTGVLLTTLLWTFSASISKTAHSAQSFHLAYSPIELSILTTYFVLIFLLPHVIGVARGAEQQKRIVGLKTEVLSKAIGILRIPKSDSYAHALSGLLRELETQLISFVNSDKSILFGLSFDNAPPEGQVLNQSEVNDLPSSGQIDAGEHDRASASSTVVLAPNKETQLQQGVDVVRQSALYDGIYKNFDPRNYRLARSYDLRFQYLEWLDSLCDQLATTISDLATKRAGTARVSAARAWADSYEQNRKDLAQLVTGTKTNAVTAFVASTLATSLLSLIVTGVGNWLWTQVAHTLLK